MTCYCHCDERQDQGGKMGGKMERLGGAGMRDGQSEEEENQERKLDSMRHVHSTWHCQPEPETL